MRARNSATVPLTICQLAHAWSLTRGKVCHPCRAGAIVEPDCAERILWTGSAVFNGTLALLSGLYRDRLDYMAHLPSMLSAWTYMRVLALLTCILGVAATVLVLGCALRSEAGASVLSLFFFQARAVQLSLACALRDFESRRNGT